MARPQNMELFHYLVSALLFGPVLTTLAGAIYLIKRSRAYSRLAKQHDGRLCRRCMYPMDISGVAQCPECGLAQNMDETVAAWLKFVRGKRASHPRS